MACSVSDICMPVDVSTLHFIAVRCTMQPRRGRGQTQLGLGVIMLASQLLNVGLDRIPPATLATIAAQVCHGGLQSNRSQLGCKNLVQYDFFPVLLFTLLEHVFLLVWQKSLSNNTN